MTVLSQVGLLPNRAGKLSGDVCCVGGMVFTVLARAMVPFDVIVFTILS